MSNNIPFNPAQVLYPSAPPELQPHLQAMVHDRLIKHGIAAFAAPRRSAIAHETSHAIVGQHEGFKISRVTIHRHTVPPFGECWGGWCSEDSGRWTVGPDTDPGNDLRRSRFLFAGLAGESVTGQDLPGSSLDELLLSQGCAAKAAAKLGVDAQTLWHEQIERAVIAIIRANRKPFEQLVALLDRKEKVQGSKLRSVLAQVIRVPDR